MIFFLDHANGSNSLTATLGKSPLPGPGIEPITFRLKSSGLGYGHPCIIPQLSGQSGFQESQRLPKYSGHWYLEAGAHTKAAQLPD